MKKKNREINIFSMSALDLFASAMGAFLLISVIALPYYLKVDKNLIEQVKSLKEKLKKSEEQKKQAQQENQKLKQQQEEMKKQNAKMQKELSKTFCVISMKWKHNAKQDVDLHVIDPDGDEYYYKKKIHRGKSAFFAVDAKGVKKGAEVWVDKELKPGDYKISYVYYAGTGNVAVKGSVFTKSFTEDLPVKVIANPDSDIKIPIATIHVDQQGVATLEVN